MVFDISLKVLSLFSSFKFLIFFQLYFFLKSKPFSENLFVASESNCFLIIGGPFDDPKEKEELISVGISMTDITTS